MRDNVNYWYERQYELQAKRPHNVNYRYETQCELQDKRPHNVNYWYERQCELLAKRPHNPHCNTPLHTTTLGQTFQKYRIFRNLRLVYS